MEGKNKILMFVIIGLLVVLIGGMGFLGFTLMNMMNADGSDQPIQVAASIPVSDLTLVSIGDTLSTNLRQGENGRQGLINTRITIGVDGTSNHSDELVQQMYEAETIIRSTTLSVARSFTFEQLSRPEGQAMLEEALLEQLRIEFASNLIHRVFFDAWIVIADM